MAPEEVGATALFQWLEARERKVLRACARCAFLDLCYGGCMFHSLKNSKVFDAKDFYCTAYRMYFEHALRRIHSELFCANRDQMAG
jgi:sulfatase maturation enzyme AslB (radical SAM superfamily)